MFKRPWGCLLTCGRKQPDGDNVPRRHRQTSRRVDLAWARFVGDVALAASSGCCGWCWPRVTVVTWRWWLGVGGWALVARRWWLGVGGWALVAGRWWLGVVIVIGGGG